MDARLHNLLRQYNADQANSHLHSRLISSALRSGFLDFSHVALCAFLGHPAAKIVCSDICKHDGIIFNKKKIKNIEIRDIPEGISNWGVTPLRYSILGLSKLAFEYIRSKYKRKKKIKLVDNISLVVDISENILKNNYKPEVDERLRIRNITNQIIDIYPRRGTYKLTSCYLLIFELTQTVINNGQNRIFLSGSTVSAMTCALSWFDDEEFMGAIRSEIYSWALKDFV